MKHLRPAFALTLALSSTAPALAFELETVNSVPQYTQGEHHFLFYWAVWARMTPEETALASSDTGAQLLSRRKGDWTSHDCSTGAVTMSDGEDFYYTDELNVGDDGLVLPMREAYRPGYRYFVVASLNGWQLRKAEAYVSPKRVRGEDQDAREARENAAYQKWTEDNTPRGTYGFVDVETEMRVYPGRSSPGEFFSLTDYRNFSPEQRERIEAFAPSRWPFYYDERAHKPHSLDVPSAWRSPDAPIAAATLRMRFNWNWCDGTKPARVKLTLPPGGLPPPGPNRSGRSDSGRDQIPTESLEDWKNPRHYLGDPIA